MCKSSVGLRPVWPSQTLSRPGPIHFNAQCASELVMRIYLQFHYQFRCRNLRTYSLSRVGGVEFNSGLSAMSKRRGASLDWELWLRVFWCDSFRFFAFAGKLVPFIELTGKYAEISPILIRWAWQIFTSPVAHASILTILAISFERYYAICEPLKAGYVCTKTRAMVICVVCWFVAGLFTRYGGHLVAV